MSRHVTMVGLVKRYREAVASLEARVKERLPPGRRVVHLPTGRITRVLPVPIADTPDEVAVKPLGGLRWSVVKVEHLYPVSESWLPDCDRVPAGVDIPRWRPVTACMSSNRPQPRPLPNDLPRRPHDGIARGDPPRRGRPHHRFGRAVGYRSGRAVADPARRAGRAGAAGVGRGVRVGRRHGPAPGDRGRAVLVGEVAGANTNEGRVRGMDEPTKELLAHYRAENARLVGERDRLWAENRRLWLAVAKLQRATGQFYSLSLQNVIPCEGAHESAFDSCTDADEILDGLVALDPAGDGK